MSPSPNTDPADPSFSCRVVGDIPMLVLSGCWLASVGFSIGTRVQVEIEPGQILLTALEAEHAASR